MHATLSTRKTLILVVDFLVVAIFVKIWSYPSTHVTTIFDDLSVCIFLFKIKKSKGTQRPIINLHDVFVKRGGFTSAEALTNSCFMTLPHRPFRHSTNLKT